MFMQHQELHDRIDQNFWNLVFSLFFIAFLIILFYILYRVRGNLPTSISVVDIFIISLASFRIIRLFVYDKITRFIRDLFLHIDEVYSEEGVTYFTHKEHIRGWRRTISDLLACPWCFSIWAASVVICCYFLSPLSWLPIFILAISGVASMLQIISNTIGWNAEKNKLEAKLLEKDSH